MKHLLCLFFAVPFFSCSTEPEPITYGRDACDYCEMIIVDKAFAARAVTDKGKQYKYDAIECLVNDLHQHNREMAVIQVADFEDPGKMMPLENAVFLQEDSINSPMGMNLAALKKGSSIAKDYSSDIFSWEELKTRLKQLNDTITNR